MNLIEQARQWPQGLAAISDWLGSDGAVVDSEMAQARANVCLICPYHEPKQSVTGIMADAFKRVLEIKNRLGLRVAGQKRLGLCGICSCSTNLKIWMILDRILKQTSEIEMKSYPNYCWIIKEQV